MESDDTEIVRASVAQPERFETIFDRHHRRLWAYLAHRNGRDAADELAGDVFTAAFAQRATYDPARGSVVSWLYGIAANMTRTRFRRKGRAYRALGRMAAEVSDARPIDDTTEAVAHGQDLARVRAAMAALSDQDREIIALVAWERLSYAEIAVLLDVEIGTVRSRLSRARCRLRELAGLDDQMNGKSQRQVKPGQAKKVSDVSKQ